MDLNCKACDKPFKTKPYLVRQGKGLYCARKCKQVSVIKQCQNCQKEMLVEPNRIKSGRGKFCSRRCSASVRKGEKANNWKGGRASCHGYILLYAPDHPRNSRRYVREHILVAEKALGRFLEPKEVIHHINEVIVDNRIENLYLFPSQSEHMKYHMLYRVGKHPEITESNLI